MVIYLAGLGFFIFCEYTWPRWKLPQVSFWYVRLFIFIAIGAAIVSQPQIVVRLFPPGYSLLNLAQKTNVLFMTVIGYLSVSLVKYWWHRLRHASAFLWRHLHQIHHSATRVETLTALYKHPLENVIFVFIHVIVFWPVLGLSYQAIANCILLFNLGEAFQHANIKTPRWLGYFLSTPGVHRVHHEYGKHTGNFSDLVLWDMIFGTYVNPHQMEGPFGFDAAKENQVLPMLLFRDVDGLNLKTKN